MYSMPLALAMNVLQSGSSSQQTLSSHQDMEPPSSQRPEERVRLSGIDTGTDHDFAIELRTISDHITISLTDPRSSSHTQQDTDPVATHAVTSSLHDDHSAHGQTRTPECAGDAIGVPLPEPQYKPIRVPDGFLALDYRPAILKKSVTFSLASLYAVIIAGLCILTKNSDQISKSTIINPNIYMAARFGPALIGTVTTILVRVFLSELCRMLPYIAMADTRKTFGNATAAGSVAALYFPTLSTLTVQSWLIVGLQFITTPLMAVKIALLEVIVTSNGWSVIAHPDIARSLIAYYAIQILVLLVVTAWLWSRTMGLRSDWDPVSIADVVALFQHFNVEKEFFETPADATARLWPLHDWRFRLGYWEMTTFDTDAADKIPRRIAIVYGIRGTLTSDQPHATRLQELKRVVPTRMPSRMSLLDRLPTWCTKRYKAFLLQRSTIRTRFQHATKAYNSQPDFPYRFLPVLGFGRAMWMAKAALGLCLILAMIAVACVRLTNHLFMIDQNNDFGIANETLVLANVSNPNLTAAGSIFYLRGSQGEQDRLTLWNFILRTIPVTVAGLVILVSGHFSRYHNYIQPFKEMLTGPSPANTTILLDYMTLSGTSIILQAWEHCHWKVFSFAVLSMLNPLAQLVPTGMLILTSKDGIIYGGFSRGFVIASILVLAVYLSAYVYGYWTAKQRYPRWGTSLIDIWALCFSSRLARYPEFAECRPGWTKKDLVATLQLRSDKYLLGVVRGTDGRNRAGFEVATIDRQETPTGAVRYVSPKHPHSRSHCAACSVDSECHDSIDAERLRLLREHYHDLAEPIDVVRGFEDDGPAASVRSGDVMNNDFTGSAGGGMATTGDEANDANAVGGIGVSAEDES